MQIAAENELIVHQLDVKTAYLNAPIDCEIYIKQPKGFNEQNDTESLVWKLNKSLYGLKQSGRNWNSLLKGVLEEKEYRQSDVDHCVFFKNDRDLNFVIFWVDDIIIATKTIDVMNTTKQILKEKFKMKELGPI